jgi:hypothetical protein
MAKKVMICEQTGRKWKFLQFVEDPTIMAFFQTHDDQDQRNINKLLGTVEQVWASLDSNNRNNTKLEITYKTLGNREGKFSTPPSKQFPHGRQLTSTLSPTFCSQSIYATETNADNFLKFIEREAPQVIIYDERKKPKTVGNATDNQYLVCIK